MPHQPTHHVDRDTIRHEAGRVAVPEFVEPQRGRQSRSSEPRRPKRAENWAGGSECRCACRRRARPAARDDVGKGCSPRMPALEPSGAPLDSSDKAAAAATRRPRPRPDLRAARQRRDPPPPMRDRRTPQRSPQPAATHSRARYSAGVAGSSLPAIIVLDLAASAVQPCHAVPGRLHDDCPSCDAVLALGRIRNCVEWTSAPGWKRS